MAVIPPTLTLVSNAAGSTPSNLAGPLSVALSLSATSTLTVDDVSSGIANLTASEATLFDGSSFSADGVGGTVGGYLYLKNTSTTTIIYIGIVADDGSPSNLAASGNGNRLFTLKPGEFAWMPYDYTMDIITDIDSTTATLEWWRFDRG